jgi:oligopeptide transport system permease protein
MTLTTSKEIESPGLWQLAWRRVLRDKVAIISMSIVALFVVMMLASRVGLVASHWNEEVAASYAPAEWHVSPPINHTKPTAGMHNPHMSAPVDISDIDPLAKYYPELDRRASAIEKTQIHRATWLPLGADKWGRDVLAKTIKGAEVSVSVGVLAALLAVIIGTMFGALAGYFGAYVDDVLEWFYSVFTSIPYILLILAVAAIFSRGFITIVLILGLTSWTGVYRLVRSEYLKHSERAYVRAAEALGASHASRMFKHILPNISHVILVQYSRYVVDAIKAEVVLSFLGLGVPVSMVSWGTILAETQEEVVIGIWTQVIAAGGSMAILVTAISMLTDSLRDALDPKLND